MEKWRKFSQDGEKSFQMSNISMLPQSMKGKPVDKKSSRGKVKMTADDPTRAYPASTHKNWHRHGPVEHDGTISNSISQPVLYL